SNIATTRDVANNDILEAFVDTPLHYVSAFLLDIENSLIEDVFRMLDASWPGQMQVCAICNVSCASIGVGAGHADICVFFDCEVALSGQCASQSQPPIAAYVFIHLSEM